MGQPTVNRAAGGTVNLWDTSKAIILKTYEQRVRFMEDDYVDVILEASGAPGISIGDYITVFARKYTLNQQPRVTKTGRNRFEYAYRFEGALYDMLRVQFFNITSYYAADGLDSTDNLFTTEFSHTGNVQSYVQMLVHNMNRVYGAGVWSLGTTYSSEYKTLTFSGENCLNVINRLADEFNLEWRVDTSGGVHTLHMRTVGELGTSTGKTWKYGRGNGLQEITRKNVDREAITTRLYAYGSDRNLPSNYRGYARRLKLAANEMSYLEDASAKTLYGLIEETKIFDEIYPHRSGDVSSVTSMGTTYAEFVDSSMSFDLNDYLIPGTSAKVHFNTGNLGGYQFEVHQYTHSTKTFKILTYKDERGQVFPDPGNSAFQIQSGDDYVIIDITLPQAYIDTAESALLTEATSYLNRKKQPIVEYAITLDPFYVNDNFTSAAASNNFWAGDYVHFEDSDLGVDKDIRVLGFTRDLIHPLQYTLDIGDDERKPKWVRNLYQGIKNSLAIANNNLTNVNRARFNRRTVQEIQSLMLTDGYIKASIIANDTITTAMIDDGAVTTEKLDPSIDVSSRPQVYLPNVLMEMNYQGDKNKIKVNTGEVTVKQGGDTDTYTVQESTITITDNNKRLLFVKCAIGGTSASIEQSTSWIDIGDVEDYEHHFIGVANAVRTYSGVDYRSFSNAIPISTTQSGCMTRGGLAVGSLHTSEDSDSGIEIEDGTVTGYDEDGYATVEIVPTSASAMIVITEYSSGVAVRKTNIRGGIIQLHDIANEYYVEAGPDSIAWVDTNLSATSMLLKYNWDTDDSEIIFPNLPTSDPRVSGQLWNNSGTLKVSSG